MLSEGVRSFHAATMFRTEVRGERGEVWGRRREEAVGVAVVVKPVNVFVFVYVPEVAVPEGVYVLVPLRVWVNVPLLVGKKRESVDSVVPRAEGDMREDVAVIGPEDDTDEPALLLVGDEGREL